MPARRSKAAARTKSATRKKTAARKKTVAVRRPAGRKKTAATKAAVRKKAAARRKPAAKTSELAFDFFTVETAWLSTLYVLFAIELGSRCVHILGVTTNPDSGWVTQQARNLAVGEGHPRTRFLIRDRDAKFSGPFDEVFRSEGVNIIETPVRAPRANAFAERWIRTIRTECLDWTLVLGRRHLERVLRIYEAHYNARRPHRGLDLKTPDPRPDPDPWPADGARVRTRDLLGGVIHEYELAA